jgi:hypothetical protein
MECETEWPGERTVGPPQLMTGRLCACGSLHTIEAGARLTRDLVLGVLRGAAEQRRPGGAPQDLGVRLCGRQQLGALLLRA